MNNLAKGWHKTTLIDSKNIPLICTSTKHDQDDQITFPSSASLKQASIFRNSNLAMSSKSSGLTSFHLTLAISKSNQSTAPSRSRSTTFRRAIYRHAKRRAYEAYPLTASAISASDIAARVTCTFRKLFFQSIVALNLAIPIQLSGFNSVV